MSHKSLTSTKSSNPILNPNTANSSGSSLTSVPDLNAAINNAINSSLNIGNIAAELDKLNNTFVKLDSLEINGKKVSTNKLSSLDSVYNTHPSLYHQNSFDSYFPNQNNSNNLSTNQILEALISLNSKPIMANNDLIGYNSNQSLLNLTNADLEIVNYIKSMEAANSGAFKPQLPSNNPSLGIESIDNEFQMLRQIKQQMDTNTATLTSPHAKAAPSLFDTSITSQSELLNTLMNDYGIYGINPNESGECKSNKLNIFIIYLIL